MQGGTNWYSPSYSPRTGLFYVAAWKDYYSYFSKLPGNYNEGQSYFGGMTKSAYNRSGADPINTWTDVAGHGEIVALDPFTGKEKWAFKMHDVTRRRNPDYGHGPAVHWQPGRLFLGAGCA